MKYVHVSKELVVVPRMALGTGGKLVVVQGEYDYRLAKEGNTFVRPTPKLNSRRDVHRIASAMKRDERHRAGHF